MRTILNAPATRRTSRLFAAVAAAVLQATAVGAQDAPVRFHRAALSSGVTLRYAEAGDPEGEVVLFLHGLSDSWLSWGEVLGRLPRGVRGIALDQRGHGESDQPACCYGMPDLVADAVALLDRLGVARATIVGHSMGGFVAQSLAARHPERVRRLVVIGNGPSVRVPPLVEFAAAVRQIGDTLPSGFAREFQVSTIHTPIAPAALDAFVAESERLPPRVWKGLVAGLLADDERGRSSRIAAPTLIVNGEKDAFWTPVEARTLQRGIRGAELQLLPETGHAVHWERLDAFVRTLSSFIERTSR
jgi:non-heme chloroperoxidase